jgi:hypothetical protein
VNPSHFGRDEQNAVLDRLAAEHPAVWARRMLERDAKREGNGGVLQ